MVNVVRIHQGGGGTDGPDADELMIEQLFSLEAYLSYVADDFDVLAGVSAAVTAHRLQEFLCVSRCL